MTKYTTAEDIMSSPVVTTRRDTVLTEALGQLLRWHISGMPVLTEKETLCGIITEHDILNFALSGDAADATVGEAMSRKVTTFPPDARFESLVNWFAAHRIRRVPIVTGKRVVGIVSRRDILREMKRLYDAN